MKIKISDLKKIYKVKNKDLEILNGVNLEIEPCESITIYGPSGAGKSTLLHLIGLIDKPSSGNIFINNIDVTKIDEEERAKIRKSKIGFIFQNHHLLNEFSAIENVMLPLIINGSSNKNAKVKAELILDKLGLKQRENHNPNELSGGEQQRIAIARALVNSPELVLADEPTGNLDTENSKIVQELIFSLQKELKFTLLLVTHNMEIINSSHKLIMMRDGLIQ